MYIALMAIVIGVILIVAGIFAYRIASKRFLSRLLHFKLLLVELPRLPQEAGRPSEDFKAEVNKSAQLFASLAGIHQHVAFEIAVHHVGEDISFYISVPDDAVTMVERQIHGLWPDANVTLAPEYTIFGTHTNVSAAYLELRQRFVLPLRTYQEADIDTFASIVSAFSNLELVGEGMAMQVLLRPVSRGPQERIADALRQLKRGVRLSDVIQTSALGSSGVLKDLSNMFGLGISKQGTDTPHSREQITVDDEAVKTISQKAAKALFSVNVRLVTSAVSSFASDALLEGLTGAFSQFSAPMRNELRVVRPRSMKRFIFDYVMRRFDDSHAMVLNTEEVASLFHFPTRTTDVPNIRWRKTKEAPPPTSISGQGVLIGESSFRGNRVPIRVADDDRRRHIYVVGQTGTGKSTFLTTMVVDDIVNGKGVAIIDPHGDLVETILGFVPRNRLDDLIVFDPGDRERPLGMNMLEYDHHRPEQKTFIVNELFNILDKLYDMKAVGGPMFEQYTKNAILLLMEDAVNEPATLMEIPRLFTDPEFRNRKLARISNPIVVDFWQKEALKATGEHSLANMAPYITSKFNGFISNDYMRPIIGQTTSAFDFRRAMDEGKILLVNLSKGRIGDINAKLLGMVITGKILMAALSRVDLPDERRRDFYLYIDEFQNFATESIATILSEARKYHLNLTMAHQFIGQLTEEIRDAVFGNAGSLISFRVGAEDAEFLEKQFAPTFTKTDLINIDNFNAYAKLLIKGQTTMPFNLKTLKPTGGNEGLATQLKEYSRLRHGADRAAVEADILKRLRT